MQGIFNRTSVPKFDTDIPTEKAKKNANNKENNNNGFSPITLKNPKNFNRITRKTVSNKI